MATQLIQVPDGCNIQIRIGMHTGPVSSGVIGIKTPKYTLFGDAINAGISKERICWLHFDLICIFDSKILLAAIQLESSGFPMCIHVSKGTMELLLGQVEWVKYRSKNIQGWLETQSPPTLLARDVPNSSALKSFCRKW